MCAPIDPFLEPTDSPQGGDNFEKLSDNSLELWSIPLGHLLVFISGLDSQAVKNIFS